MMFHFIGVMPPEWASRGLGCKLLYRAGATGWCGVDLSFVLSGFLITGILHDTKGSPRFFSTFYARRTLRIFPLYYGTLAVILLIFPALDPAGMRGLLDRQGWFWAYAANLLRVLEGAGSCDARGLSLEHFWSLAVEEYYYLVWPFVVLALSRPGAIRACVAIAAMACRVAFVLLGDSFAAYMLTPCRVDALAIGAFLALAARGRDLATIRRLSSAAAAASGVVVAALLARGYGALRLHDRAVQTIGYPALGVLFAAAISLAATPSYGHAGPLRSPVLRFCGKYSHGLYVYHFLLQDSLRSGAAGGLPDGHPREPRGRGRGPQDVRTAVSALAVA